MTTAVDSNVLIALWSEYDVLNREARQALERASERGDLVICAPVYVEIRAFPARDESRADEFLERTGIRVEWELAEAVWRAAGRAGHAYSARRDAEKKLPRRVAADFVIGAHAVVQGYPFLTLDRRGFRASFPALKFAPESG